MDTYRAKYIGGNYFCHYDHRLLSLFLYEILYQLIRQRKIGNDRFKLFGIYQNLYPILYTYIKIHTSKSQYPNEISIYLSKYI